MIDTQVLARIYALVAEMEGMKAANKQGEINGNGIVYSEDHFQGVAIALQQLGGLHG